MFKFISLSMQKCSLFKLKKYNFKTGRIFFQTFMKYLFFEKVIFYTLFKSKGSFDYKTKANEILYIPKIFFLTSSRFPKTRYLLVHGEKSDKICSTLFCNICIVEWKQIQKTSNMSN